MPPPPPGLPPTNIATPPPKPESPDENPTDENPFLEQPSNEENDAAVARALRDALNSEAARERVAASNSSPSTLDTRRAAMPPGAPRRRSAASGQGVETQLAYIDAVGVTSHLGHPRAGDSPGEEDLTATFRGRRVRDWINDCGEQGAHAPAWSPELRRTGSIVEETVVPQDMEYKYGVENDTPAAGISRPYCAAGSMCLPGALYPDACDMQYSCC